MVDAALIHQCADANLKPAIVEQFIERAGAQDPLSVTVRSGSRVVLVSKPTTSAEAMDLIRQNIGRNTVRVGITQYPAGVGIVETGQLKQDIVEPCENIRMGTALFAKVFRIVSKWYGDPTAKEVLPQVMDDAIIAWQTGYFEGVAVFRTEDPGLVEHGRPETLYQELSEEDVRSQNGENISVGDASDPNKAGIRIDLSEIGSSR